MSICGRIDLCASVQRDANELKARITEAIVTLGNAMLKRICQELGYLFDVCRVGKDAHIELFDHHMST